MNVENYCKEHGIGKTRIKNLNQYLDEKAIEIMKKIKEIFDPNNILNPGKMGLEE